MNAKAALKGGAKLHALIAACCVIEEEELTALIEYTAGDGEVPNKLSHESAKAFKVFKDEIERIHKRCQKSLTAPTLSSKLPSGSGGPLQRY